MNMKRDRPPTKPSRLENEVILAVVMLYVLLSAAMLVIHYVHPAGTPTQSSSTSPSHAATETAVPDAKAADQEKTP